MKSKYPDEYFIIKLEQELLKLPSYKIQSERNDSWMTSKEIADIFLHQFNNKYNEEDIENFLLREYKNGKLNNIRPAKYPNLKTMHTLWGHKEKTFPLEVENLLWKTDAKRRLPKIKLPNGAPSVFLSHSAKDFKLAKKVRQTLGEDYGFEAWLFEKELGKAANIFGSVKLGVIHCDAVILLLTSNSIGSAWIDTEIQSANEFYKKKIYTLVDGNDKDLLLVIDTYLTYKSNVSNDMFNKILEKYKLLEGSKHRIDNFKKNATNILGYLDLYSKFSIYPSMTFDENGLFISMSKAMEDIKANK